MTGCFCTGACHNGGRCPNAPWSMADMTQRSIDINKRCANDAMDEWERHNLPLEQRGKPRMLSCPCPKCNLRF